MQTTTTETKNVMWKVGLATVAFVGIFALGAVVTVAHGDQMYGKSVDWLVGNMPNVPQDKFVMYADCVTTHVPDCLPNNPTKCICLDPIHCTLCPR